MKPLLKDIIIDQKSLFIRKKTIERKFPEQYLHSEQVIIISGVRRCGKSVLLQQIREKMPQKDYFFNFDDDRLGGFNIEHFQQLYEVFIELYGEQDYFYFDEIQNMPAWESFVKRLYNLGKKVFITGSNARMLSKELGTLLTGCYINIELYPFSFHEFLLLRNHANLLENVQGSVEKGQIESLFGEYLVQGGFPIYLKSQDDMNLKILYENILYKDILVRNQLTNERELKELVYFIVSNIGKPFSHQSLAKVVGVKSSTTIKNYLEYIENTYLLFSISKFDFSVKTQFRNPKKIYAIDNAMIRRLGFHFSREEGRLLENLVHLELRRRGYDIYYHQSATSECDFIVRDGYQVVEAMQVCFFMDNPETRQRELKGIVDALDHYELPYGYIITGSHEEDVQIRDKTIHILPCWKWLLS